MNDDQTGFFDDDPPLIHIELNGIQNLEEGDEAAANLINIHIIDNNDEDYDDYKNDGDEDDDYEDDGDNEEEDESEEEVDEEKKSEFRSTNMRSPETISQKKVQTMIIELYNTALIYQSKKDFVRAYAHYRAIMHVISTEPMIWIRMAECIMAMLAEPNQHFLPVTYQDFKCGFRLRMNNVPGLQNAVKELEAAKNEDSSKHWDEEEISEMYADMCMTTCSCLLNDYDDVILKKYSLILHAYIMGKLGGYMVGQGYLNDALVSPCGVESWTMPPQLELYAKLLKIEITMLQGKAAEALTLLEKIPNTQLHLRAHIRFHYNKTLANLQAGNLENARVTFQDLYHVASLDRGVMTLGAYVYSQNRDAESSSLLFRRILHMPQVIDSEKVLEELIEKRLYKDLGKPKYFKFSSVELPSGLPPDEEWQYYLTSWVQYEDAERERYKRHKEQLYEDYKAGKLKLDEWNFDLDDETQAC